jgi:hypothetical protein
MSEQQTEYIITLHRKEDLDDFYSDMETPGGNLYIPDRTVNVHSRRKISRNTHYFLTAEEAGKIKEDPRVWDVQPADLIRNSIKPNGYKLENNNFDRSTGAGADNVNWGLYRHNIDNNIADWGGSIDSIVRDLTITSSGKNVDVVIFDGHIDTAHPEFAVNADGTGGSRVNQINWFTYNSELGLGADGNYVYTPYTNGDTILTKDNNHGCHVAGTAVGNTQGWARNASIYNINIYPSNPNGNIFTDVWDYVRYWHNNKPVNPVTGRRNPTVTNHSYGSDLTYNDGDFGPVTRVIYRGVDFDPGRSLTVQELQDRGFNTTDTSPTVPFYFTNTVADIQDAIVDGIIVVAAAGNENWRVVNSSDQDWNNSFYATLKYLMNKVLLLKY